MIYCDESADKRCKHYEEGHFLNIPFTRIWMELRCGYTEPQDDLPVRPGVKSFQLEELNKNNDCPHYKVGDLMRFTDGAFVKAGRSKEYLDYIRTQDCYVCQRPAPSIPHHTTSRGMGLKGSDFGCVPMCREHHDELHQIGRLTFQTQYAVILTAAVTDLLVYWCDRYRGD